VVEVSEIRGGLCDVGCGVCARRFIFRGSDGGIGGNWERGVRFRTGGCGTAFLPTSLLRRLRDGCGMRCREWLRRQVG